MLQKTRGIILRTFKYSETSVICKVYTEEFGQQSYMVNGVRSPKAKINSGLLQPGSLLDMVVYYREGKDLQRVSEIKRAHIFTSLPFDIYKSTTTLFMMEAIYKSVKENESNPEMFNYIFDSIKYLDEKKGILFNFHLYFIIHLTKYLGCFPGGAYTKDTTSFDLQQGIFTVGDPGNIHCVTHPISKYLSEFLHCSIDNMDNIQLSGKQKKEMLGTLMLYYRFHIDRFTNIKSSQILEEIVWGENKK